MEKEINNCGELALFIQGEIKKEFGINFDSYKENPKISKGILSGFVSLKEMKEDLHLIFNFFSNGGILLTVYPDIDYPVTPYTLLKIMEFNEDVDNDNWIAIIDEDNDLGFQKMLFCGSSMYKEDKEEFADDSYYPFLPKKVASSLIFDALSDLLNDTELLDQLIHCQDETTKEYALRLKSKIEEEFHSSVTMKGEKRKEVEPETHEEKEVIDWSLQFSLPGGSIGFLDDILVEVGLDADCVHDYCAFTFKNHPLLVSSNQADLILKANSIHLLLIKDDDSKYWFVPHNIFFNLRAIAGNDEFEGIVVDNLHSLNKYAETANEFIK